MEICIFCSKEFKNRKGLGSHKYQCSLNPNRVDMNRRSPLVLAAAARRRGIPLSDEVRKKVSDGIKRYYSDNPDKHPWKNNSKFISSPCEKVKQILRDNEILYVEEWQPLEDRLYSIDIAFPDIKLGLEINGNQHYNKDGSLKEYYQNRHDLIEMGGWKILELHYTSCFNEELILNIINIKEQPDYSVFFTKKAKKDEPIKMKRGEKLKLAKSDFWEPYKTLILTSNIDFSKWGWVGKVSIILQIQSGGIKRWMKRNMPEFYEKECFKRKTSPINSEVEGQTLNLSVGRSIRP